MREASVRCCLDPLDSMVKALEQVKREAPNGEDYWMGRDIQAILGYAKWDTFEGVIERSKMACENAGFRVAYHFLDTRKMISGGKGAKLEKSGLLPDPVTGGFFNAINALPMPN